MLPYTEIIKVSRYSDEIRSIASFYSHAITSLTLGNLEICYSNRFSKLCLADMGRTLFDIIKTDQYPESKIASIFHSLMVSIYYDAESKSAGSGLVCLMLLLNFLLGTIDNKNASLQIEKALKESRYLSYSEWKDTIKHWVMYDKRCADIFLASMQLAGPSAQINIQCDNLKQTQIEKRSGYTLGYGVDPRMIHSIKGTWIANECAVCLIDGIVESVSEIHHVLEEFSKQGVLY